MITFEDGRDISRDEFSEYIRGKLLDRIFGFSNEPFPVLPGDERNNWEMVG